MMLGHNFYKSQCPITTPTLLLPLHNHFHSSAANVASSFPIPHRNSLSKRRKVRLHRASNGVKALLTSTEKSTSVKAVITVLQTVGGALSHLGLSRGLDDITDVLGRTLLVELVAAELDATFYWKDE